MLLCKAQAIDKYMISLREFLNTVLWFPVVAKTILLSDNKPSREGVTVYGLDPVFNANAQMLYRSSLLFLTGDHKGATVETHALLDSDGKLEGWKHKLQCVCKWRGSVFTKEGDWTKTGYGKFLLNHKCPGIRSALVELK